MLHNIHRFKIPINCKFPFEGILDILQDNEDVYYDFGILALPDSYCKSGKKTRLVINCHGAGGTVTTDDSQVEQQTVTKYLLANGYAVMDVNGLPERFSKENDIDIRNNIGSYIAIQSYIKAYHYCIDNFNLKSDVFINGGSMGGISSTNLVLSGCIPVIAQSGLCPVLDTYNQIFLHPWSGGLPKTALEKLYHLNINKCGNSIYEEEKLIGFNPMGRLICVGNTEYLHYLVPVKFWHCEDDEIVNIESTKRFISAIRNAGCPAYLRTFPTGGHEPQLYGDFLQSVSGNTLWDDEQLQIKPAVEELFLWIKCFD